MERVPRSEIESTEATDGVRLALLAGTASMNVQHFEIEPVRSSTNTTSRTSRRGSSTRANSPFTEGEEIACGPGDSYAIPGGEPHAAEHRGDVTVRGVDIFSPPRENPSWRE